MLECCFLTTDKVLARLRCYKVSVWGSVLGSDWRILPSDDLLAVCVNTQQPAFMGIEAVRIASCQYQFLALLSHIVSYSFNLICFQLVTGGILVYFRSILGASWKQGVAKIP